MQQDVSFEFNHLGHTWDVNATFERQDKPRLAQYAETGYEGEWQLLVMHVNPISPFYDENRDVDWRSVMRDYKCVKRPLTIPCVWITVEDLVLEQAYEELEKSL